MINKNEEIQTLSQKYLTDLVFVAQDKDPNKAYELLNNIDLPLNNHPLMKSLFKLSLDNKQYIVSIYLFIKMNSINNFYFIKLHELRDNLKLYDLLDAITKILKTLPYLDIIHRCVRVLPELIAHINNSDSKIMNTSLSLDGHMSSPFTTNMCTNFYTIMCNQSDNFEIDDWENVEAEFLKHFKPDYNQSLFIAMISFRQTSTISHLLKTNKVNILEKTWFRKETGEFCLGVNETLGQISPFQAKLEHMSVSSANFCGISFDLPIIRILIQQEPLCITLRDRKTGKNILDKIKELKTISIEKKNGECLEAINQTLAVINDASPIVCRIKYATFFHGTNDNSSNLSVLKDDIRHEIGRKLQDVSVVKMS